MITRGVASGGILVQSVGGGGGYTAFANGSLQLGALNSHGVLSAGRIELKIVLRYELMVRTHQELWQPALRGWYFVAGQTGEIVNVMRLGGSGEALSKSDPLRIKLNRSSKSSPMDITHREF